MSEEMLDLISLIKSNISSDMNKPCWKLAKACPQSQKLFCFGENNLPVFIKSNISSDMNKPCWKLAKACPQRSQKLFCFGENNLPVLV